MTAKKLVIALLTMFIAASTALADGPRNFGLSKTSPAPCAGPANYGID